MSDETIQEKQAGGMALSDIYFILFRRKWIILLCAAAGIVGAAALMASKPPRYYSEAKLYIRYVEQNTSPVPPGTPSSARSLNEQESSILNTEGQILYSADVAAQVVDAIGADRILARFGGGKDPGYAASLITKNLEVGLQASSGSVITLSFQHPDPEIAQEVLKQLIVAYITKHKEMHQSVGIFGEFLGDETDRLRKGLAETEELLKEAKKKAGVTSLDEAKQRNSQDIAKVREQLFSAQAEMASYEAVLTTVQKPASSTAATNSLPAEPPPQRIAEYKQICARLERFSNRLDELLLYFTAESRPVAEVRQQVVALEEQKKKLEQDYPVLTGIPVAGPSTAAQGPTVDPRAEAALKVRMITSKISVLNSQLVLLRTEAARIDETEGTILDLQRKKDLQEADLKYFASRLEQARIEGAAGLGKAPNIGIMDSPTPPVKAWSKAVKKKVQMVLFGGAAGGVALAFLIEMLLDRSIKRPGEVTAKLGLPLLISIPDLRRNGHRRLAGSTGKQLLNGNGHGHGPGADETGRESVMPAPDEEHPLRNFYEGLRDRLIVYFEVRNFKEKPKLIAVTSCGPDAGVTTTAAGLAASLSETGDGNVLLVDMNVAEGTSQHFHKGKAACRLDDVLEPETRETETPQSALVQSDVYIAAEPTESDQLLRVLPPRFAHLMPKLKASDYDYIIFDLPPITQTSMTPRMARLMDMVLLVIEAEKTSQDVVKQATGLLAESKVSVSAVLNKTRSYVPRWLHREFLNEP